MPTRKMIVEVIADTRSVQRNLDKAARAQKGFTRDLERGARGAVAATVSYKGLGRAAGFASAQFLGGAGLVFAFKSVVNEASRVQEETEKTNVIFGRNAAEVQKWSRTLAQSFGVGSGAALEAAGQFGNMLRPLGFAPKLAADMSKRLVELGADMASFNNIKPDEALLALQAGLAGQVRPLRRLGVFLSVARIKEEALTAGITKNANKLTQAQKVQAAYNIILKDTRLQQGDVARNTESLSVAQSKLRAGIENLEEGIGTKLLPSLTNYINRGAEWINNDKNAARVQRDVGDAIKTTKEIITTASDVIKRATDAVGGFRNAFTLLLGLKVVSTFTKWAIGIDALIGAEAAASAGAKGAAGLAGASGLARLLLTRLALLAKVSPITIPISLVITNELSGGGVTKFLQDLRKKLNTQIGPVPIPLGSVLLPAFPESKKPPKVKLSPADRARAQERDVVNAVANRGDVRDAQKAALKNAIGPDDVKKAKISAKQRNEWFDAMIGRKIDRVQDIASLKGQAAALAEIAKEINQRISVTKDITRKLTLGDKLLDVKRQRKGVLEQISDKLKEDAKTLRENLKQRREDIKQAKADALSIAKDAVDAQRAVFGELGQGPVLTGDFFSRVKEFGGKPNLKAFTSDLRAQTKQFTQLQNNFAKASKLGAPAALLKQFRDQGAGGAEELAAFVAAGKRDRQAFLTAFARSQKAIQKAATIQIQAQTVTVAAKNGLPGATIHIKNEVPVAMHDTSRAVDNSMRKNKFQLTRYGGRH